MDDFCRLLKESKIEFYKNYKLSAASTFNIGGEADIAAFPSTEKELAFIIRNCKERSTRFEVIGNASNVLFSDLGYRGVIIFTKKINWIDLDKENRAISCGCGTKLVTLSACALNASLSGLEFAHGIPGTVGGAVYMNAGAYGAQISDILLRSYAYDIKTDNFITLDNASHNFGYRQSVYIDNKDLVCLGATFTLDEGTYDAINAQIAENAQKRRNSQPLQYPSAGSYFKRPLGHFAGKLIEDCSLKGFSVGGACVSQKHAGFIINTGGATANDVLSLAEHIKKTVYERFSVILESEVKYIE